MPRVTRSPRADTDLEEIIDHIAAHSRSAAERLATTLLAKARLYAQHPAMGRLRPELGPDIRSFPHGAYIVFYSPSQDGVIIRRILHGARHLNKDLFP